MCDSVNKDEAPTTTTTISSSATESDSPKESAPNNIQFLKSSFHIFKLNVDCFDEIFDYLSTRDLLALGQTCKIMQQVVGEYFKENYTAATKFGGSNGIYRVFSKTERAEISGFNQFIRYFSHCSNDQASLRYIAAHADEFKSVNHLYLSGVHLVAGRIRCIQSVLNKMEIIQIRQCSLQYDFYESFLKYCDNLKQLYVQHDLGDIIKKDENNWLFKTYKKLEHLELQPSKLMSFDVSELERFFQLNPSVRSFTTSISFLMENQQKFIDSKICIDTFGVRIHRHSFRFRMFDLQQNMTTIFDLLNRLYERGFFKRLELNVTYVDAEYTNGMTTLHGLEKLSINRIMHQTTFNLYRVSNLKELAILVAPPTFDMEVLAQELLKLERLYISRATFADILPFIRHSIRLTSIILKDERFVDNRLNVWTLNEERQKLKNARKTTIYISDELFIAMKWATFNGDTDMNLIKIQRNDSFRWEHYYH